MKKKLKFLISVMALCFSANTLAAKTIDLFVLCGQSNLFGNAGDASAYPADPQDLDTKIRFFWVIPSVNDNTGTWTYLQPQAGIFPAGHFGPEISFARDLLTVGYRPAVFKYSYGGTSLAEHWKGPGENGLYDKMRVELKRAIAQLRKKGFLVKFRALVWIQGESDAKTREMAEAYGQRLKTLIEDFRVNVAKNPKLPVILGADEQHPWVQLHPEIVAAQRQIAAEDNHILYTSMKGLIKADPTHLTPCGILAHGEILFAAFIKLSKTLPKSAANEHNWKPIVSCN